MSALAPLTRIQPTRWYSPVSSIAGINSTLETRVRALECARDARAAFCRVYRDRIRRIDSQEGDARPRSHEQLEVDLAQTYLIALQRWDAREISSISAPWRAVFAHGRNEASDDAMAARIATVAQLALDLPLAIARLSFASASTTAVRHSFDASWKMVAHAAPLLDEAWRTGEHLRTAGEAEAARAFARAETDALKHIALITHRA